ncbi:hypothetical protein PUNSTDRAFT_54754, partial [Punctularia strigosozonata HHB-11173 SS5]|uniref:uncharacterized protein n=1 Tax=Punctularia strigosozonata (strain HHB-11173) TaxID=741275 RepID=UPI0004418716
VAEDLDDGDGLVPSSKLFHLRRRLCCPHPTSPFLVLAVLAHKFLAQVEAADAEPNPAA